jgi:pyridoxal phosphate enzyme (YggS family)
VVRENLQKVKERIASACESVGRDPGEVKIVAVTKTHPAEVVREVIAAGINIIGENHVQEAEEKHSQVEAHAEWHLVGHLQRNKVRKALSIFSMIESLDSLRLASEIEKESAKLGQITPCLIEVNTSDEETKFGVAPGGLAELVTEVLKLEHIKLVGLMTLGPLTEDKDRIRRSFLELRELRDRVENIFGCYLPHLSMGMSDDFEVAVQEGATMVRLGRVLLGPRRE